MAEPIVFLVVGCLLPLAVLGLGSLLERWEAHIDARRLERVLDDLWDDD